MKTVRGPGLFLAQFAGDAAPCDSLPEIARWAGGLGYRGVQIPTWDKRLFDLDTAATSQDYCDDIRGICAEAGLAVTELSTHLQGQLVAVHPTYDAQFDDFAAPEVRGNPAARQQWGAEQVRKALIASRRLGLSAMASFSCVCIRMRTSIARSLRGCAATLTAPPCVRTSSPSASSRSRSRRIVSIDTSNRSESCATVSCPVVPRNSSSAARRPAGRCREPVDGVDDMVSV